jgi:hypothetical protein
MQKVVDGVTKEEIEKTIIALTPKKKIARPKQNAQVK